MARTRRSNIPIPVDGSWRMVEGENDSFDTTILQDSFEDDFTTQSSQQSQFTQSSHQSSQAMSSQDSIRDFAEKADEDQVILRAPFQPSVMSAARHASADKERTPVPEFFMPAVNVNSPRRSSARSSATTIRPVANDSPPVRRRLYQQESTEESQHHQFASPESNARHQSRQADGATPRPTSSQRLGNSVKDLLVDCVVWVLSVVSMALRFAKWPVAILLSIYMAAGLAIMGKNAITQSLAASLQPICRMPGVSLLQLPICSDEILKNGATSLEFDELMNVQSEFEKVLEDSAHGVSLPMEMKRAEASVRDLRTLVKFSDLPARAELVYEFDGYVEAVRKIVNDLQTFNTHVGGAVDSVIGINRWTSRYIDDVMTKQEERNGLLAWAFSPFQPEMYDERQLVEKYVEHTAFVSEKIQTLIVEAQAILRLLTLADDHLLQIHEYVVHNNKNAKKEHNDVFWSIWTLIGANHSRLQNLRDRLTLLKQVDTQRRLAVVQLTGMVHDLGDIQTKLADLRDRVAAPDVLLNYGSPVPLSVYITTIDAGVERLQNARIRIRAQENERLQDVIAKGNPEVPMIEG
ncbi:hypothetical protein F4808DRAFT_442087 [Astrocystis sublimbata]|nr:hypothetical protein F4808DRAFT_442087 [Astrocystis sublimbata]